ncbi:hypothetical protein ASG07_10215 [Sphingomonas sp. Leaf343]|nr:hypothetical protein ASG07_10215 [Sphingomonas sp. Leaf343]
MKPAKKNVSIEVRLSDEIKSAFMDRCRDQVRSASEAIRQFIDEQVEARSPPSHSWGRYGRIGVAGLLGMVAGFGVAAPSIARSTPTLAFEQVDRNHDGVIDRREFDAR